MVGRKVMVSISLSTLAVMANVLLEMVHMTDAYGESKSDHVMTGSTSATSRTASGAGSSPSQTQTTSSLDGSASPSGTTSTLNLSGSLSTLHVVSESLAMGLAGHNAVAILASAAATAKPIPASKVGGTSTPGSTSTGSSSGGPTSGTGGASSGPPVPPTLSTTTYYVVKSQLLYKHDSTGFTYVVGPPAAFMQSGVTYYCDKANFYVRQGNSFVFAGQYENPFRQLDLRTPSSLTQQQIANYITANDPLSPLIGLAPIYVQAQQQYGVNAQYLVAHSIIESTWGSSQIAHDKNNLFGYSAYDSSPYASATTFPSKAYAIWYEAWFVRKYYLDASGTYYHGSNLDGMNVDYATDPNWAESIAAVMWNMAPYNTSQTASATPLPEATQEPVFSYPSGLSGQVSVANLNVRAGPGTGYNALTQLALGSTVSLTGWAPGWYRVTLSNGVTGYVSSQYVQPTNLGTVTGDTVNLRAGPGTDQKVIGQLQFANQVELLGTSTDKQWQHVTTMNDVTGYVYASFVAQMH